MTGLFIVKSGEIAHVVLMFLLLTLNLLTFFILANMKIHLQNLTQNSFTTFFILPTHYSWKKCY